MYNVYITYYKNGNSIVNSWTKIFGVPANDDNGFPVSNPVVKGSEDNAASFDFSMEMNSPYYDAFMQLKTLLCVEYDGDYIFFGRVLTIDGSTVYQTKRVHCEGAFGFMNDTNYEGVAERDKQKISWSTYYNRIINNHNNMVNTRNPEKGIVRGTVTIDGSTQFIPTTEERKYEPSNWTQTGSLINSLVSEFGGHMVVQYRNGLNYLDWYKYYARDLGVNRPTVSIGENIIDINTSASNVDKLFTWVTPMGDTGSNGMPVYLNGFTYTDKNGVSHTINGKHIPVSIVRDVYTDSQLNDEFHSASEYSAAQDNYGDIYKTQTFASAKTQQQLWDYTIKWIKNCYFGIASSFTIRAYDMHIVDPSRSKILLGDCVNVQYVIMENGVRTVKTKKLVCKSVSYDLFNPDNNSYTFGIPSEVLNRSYSEGRGKSGSEQAGGGGSGGGSGEEKDIELTFDGIAKWIQAAGGKQGGDIYGGNVAAQSFIDNGEVTGTAKVYDPESLPEGETIDQHKDLIFNATIAGRITATGRNIYVATNPTMGCFAFIGGRPTNLSGALPITFWYLRTGKKQTLNYTPPSLMYTEEEEQLINIMAGWDINISSKDELHNVVNNFWVGLGDNAKGLKTQIWDPIQEKFVQPFKMAFEKAGSAIFGFLGLSGQNSKIRVSDDQTEDGSDGAELESDTFTFGTFLDNWLHPKVQLDGGNSQVKAGFDEQGNWKSVMNASITWTDEHGQQHTTDGFVQAKDFSVPEVPSFKTKFIAVDQLVADKATIVELNSQIARIDSIETDYLKTTRLSGAIAALDSVHAKRINVDQYVKANSFAADNFYIGSVGGVSLLSGVKTLHVVPITGTSQYKLEYQTWDGGSTWHDGGTFDRAGGSILHWNWSSGTYAVLDENDTVVLSTTLQAVSPVPDSSVQKTGKVVYRPYQVMYGPDDEHVYSTGKTSTISMDASPVFDDGWHRALQDCEFPDLGTDATINVKLPNADTVEGTPRLREYTLSVDDNYAYLKRTDSGMSATAARVVNPAFARGQADAGLELDTTNKKVKRSLSSSVKEYSITADASISYDSSTHKYTAGAQSKAGTTKMQYNSTESGTEAYDAGVSDGKNAVGLSIDQNTAKVKLNKSSNAITEARISQSLGTLNKTTGSRTVSVKVGSVDNFLSSPLTDYKTGWNDAKAKITAGVSSVSWDSNSKKFVASGYAYLDGSLVKTSDAKYSGEIALDLGNLSGSSNNKSRTVSITNGRTSIRSYTINDYKDGYDANHDIWLWPGQSGSVDPIGGAGGGLYSIGYNNKDGTRVYINKRWECPVPNFREIPGGDAATTLGANKVYGLYVSWPNCGREELIGSWKTPSGDSHTTAYTMYIRSATPTGGRVKYTMEITTTGSWSTGSYITFYR